MPNYIANVLKIKNIQSIPKIIPKKHRITVTGAGHANQGENHD